MADSQYVIALNDVRKSFEGGPPVLDGLTFAVPRGAIFGLIGLNGAGKTTTIRMLAGLLPPDAGSLDVLGVRMRDRTEQLQGRIGYVLDTPLYFDWLPATAYLTWVARMQGIQPDESARRVEELLVHLDLPRDETQVIGEYSSGMKKKVSVAAALIHAPELLILDEPLEAVDAASARVIRGILTALAGRQKTVLITSHMLDTLQHFCTHLGILHNGKMLLHCPMTLFRAEAARLLQTGAEGSLEDVFLRLVRGEQPERTLSYD